MNFQKLVSLIQKETKEFSFVDVISCIQKTVFIFAGRQMAHRCIGAMEDRGFTLRDRFA